MYQDGNNIFAYEPVVRELNAISDLFDNIIWLGSRVDENRASLTLIDNYKIEPVVMPSVRRKTMNAFFALLAYPVFFNRVKKYLKRADYVMSRGPSHPAWITLQLSLKDKKRKYLHKYAGDWTKQDIPNTYKLQRNKLKTIASEHIKISVNGKEPSANKSILNIPNPCLYERELEVMNKAGAAKDFSGQLNLLFVGDLVSNKGIVKLLDAVAHLSDERYKQLYIVGGGELLQTVKDKAILIKNLDITITGVLNREELNKIYEEAHILILPSKSEGFPKVVAEGAACGCIPITTNLSGIKTYVDNGKNGFLLKDNKHETITKVLSDVSQHTGLKSISEKAMEMSKLFTYEKFKVSIAEIYGLEERL